GSKREGFRRKYRAAMTSWRPLLSLVTVKWRPHSSKACPYCDQADKNSSSCISGLKRTLRGDILNRGTWPSAKRMSRSQSTHGSDKTTVRLAHSAVRYVRETGQCSM